MTKTVYGHLQQIHLQQPGFCVPPKFRHFAAKPLAATFLPLAAYIYGVRRNRVAANGFAASAHTPKKVGNGQMECSNTEPPLFDSLLFDKYYLVERAVSLVNFELPIGKLRSFLKETYKILIEG